MAPLYETLAASSVLELDQKVLDSMRVKIAEEIKKLDENGNGKQSVLCVCAGLKLISRCSQLSILKLGICLNITDEGLSYIGNGCSKLIELDLYRSIGITDTWISAVAHGCTTLEMINVSYCENITDSSLISLSNCTKLNTLELPIGCHLWGLHALHCILSTLFMGNQGHGMCRKCKCGFNQ